MKMPTAKQIADNVATTIQVIEERVAPDWVLLKGFPRSLQMDKYSCGAQCAYAVLKYYGKARSITNVQRELGTTLEGTTAAQLRHLFTSRGLLPVTLRVPTLASLKKEIDAGHPLIVSMDTDHWANVYGYGKGCVFVSDPAINRGLLCRHSTAKFRARWDNWAMVIRY